MATNKRYRIMSRVFGTPMLAEPVWLTALGQALRSDGAFDFFDDEPAEPEQAGTIAVIPVRGGLSQRGGWFSQGYDDVRSMIDAALSDESVAGIMLDIDSPGGEVAGNFALTDYIASMRGGDTPIWARVDEQATSAAYNIAAAADRVIASESASVGSIGVVLGHVSYERALANQGIEVTYVHAGAHKVDGNPAENLTPEVQAEIQKRIDHVYDGFVARVAKNRDVSEQAVRDTEARIYTANDALALGLVDGVMGADEALQAFATHLTGSSEMADPKNDAAPAAPAAAASTGVDINSPEFKEAVAAAAAQTVLAMNAKAVAIRALPGAAERPAFTQKLIDMNLSAEQAGELLAAAPSEAKPASAAPAPAAEPDMLGAALIATASTNEDITSSLDANPSAFNPKAVADMWRECTNVPGNKPRVIN